MTRGRGGRTGRSIDEIGTLLSVSREEDLARIVSEAREIHAVRHGRRVTFYAPIYLSNFCDNSCPYCGFSSLSPSRRTALTIDEIRTEADYLHGRGIRDILLVAGASREMAGLDYLAEAVSALAPVFSSVGIEVDPLTEDEYGSLRLEGLDGVTVYQETYDEELYGLYHPSGGKSDYRYRIETPERAARAGIPKVSIGALLGLAPFRDEVPRLAAHLDYLVRRYWRTSFSVSFPRIRTEGIDFRAPHPVSDFDFVKIIAALRLVFPDIPFNLSTREEPFMRDNLASMGVNYLSAESRTDPGGYLVRKGEIEQFETGDKRSVEEIIGNLESMGIRPVFKDWDPASRPPSTRRGREPRRST